MILWILKIQNVSKPETVHLQHLGWHEDEVDDISWAFDETREAKALFYRKQFLLFLYFGPFIPFPFFIGVSRETFQLFWFSSFGSKYQCSNWISQVKCFFYSPALTRSFKFPLFFEMPSLLLWNSEPPKYAPQHAFKFSSMSPSGRR